MNAPLPAAVLSAAERAERQREVVAALAPLFEVRVPTGGDPFTVNVGQYHLDKLEQPFANRHAASLRAIYDLADLDNSVFIYQTGQDGNVLSPRYRDMSGPWAAVQYRPLRMQPASWSSTLTLTPRARALEREKAAAAIGLRPLGHATSSFKPPTWPGAGFKLWR